MTKRLITGSREICDDVIRYLCGYVSGTEDGVEIVVGDASGVDAAVITTCDVSKIPVQVHGAFNKLRHRTAYGKNIHHDAGYLERDKIMAELCDECVAFWNGFSSGTAYTFKNAIALKKPTIVYQYMGKDLVEVKVYEPGMSYSVTPREIFGHPPSVLR